VSGATSTSAGKTRTGATRYWAEHAWLPTGLATGVRFEVVDGVFAGVRHRARRASR
jgi:hypothetical protein